MEMLPFPDYIDNTMRSAANKCLQLFKREHIDHLALKEPSVHLHAGGAFASGLEKGWRAMYEKGMGEDEARREALAEIIRFYGPVIFPPTRNGDKSLENVIRAFDSYMSHYGGFFGDAVKPFVTETGRAMVEFTFSLPTEVKHPTTGMPILYVGRADRIGIRDDAMFVTDEKTASQLGEQWANNWILDSQFTGYIAAAKSHGYPIAGALVRGVGLLKTKITHAEAIVHRSEWEIDRWWTQLQKDIRRIVRAWEEDEWSFALSKDACNAYGGCPMLMLCSSPNPEQYIPIHYRERHWSPLEKDMGEHLLDSPELMKSFAAPELDIPDLLLMQKK